jgi:eukaryotic-like serine/threonine-protein kinase
VDAEQQQIAGGGPALRRLGKYELLARIGEGGMAEVHLARICGPMNFEKLVVVKTIHPDLASQGEFLKMLLDEARLSALLHHPRIVDIYDLGQADDSFFIAMEYLEGQTLSLLMTAGAKGNPLGAVEAARIIADAADGLHAAHELKTRSGVSVELVHRDVSPNNIIVLYDGNVKIVDFGIAKARGRLTQSGARQLKGKVGYASPEQLSGQPIDRRSDIYSLGVVMWEALTHRRLFRGESFQPTLDRMLAGDVPPPSRYNPLVPPQLESICLQALVADPAGRFQTAAQLRAAIDEVLRAMGSRHEREVIASYMARTFAKRREEREELVRQRAAAPPRFDPAADEGNTPAAQTTPASLPHINGQMASAPAAPAHRAHWGRVTLLGLVLLGVGGIGGVTLWKRTGQTQQPAPAAPAPAELPPPAAATPAAATPAATPPAAAPLNAIEGTPPPAKRSDAPSSRGASRPTRTAAELYREGLDLSVQGKPEEAKRRFKDAIAIDRKHAPSYRGLGLAYQALGRKADAAEALDKYLRLNPSASDADAIRARVARLRE